MEHEDKNVRLTEEVSQENTEKSTENVSRETLSGLNFSFDARFDDIFDGLEATDTADGSNRKAKRMYLVLSLLTVVQIGWFAYSRSGFALIFAVILGGLAILFKKTTQRFNRDIAKAFVNEGKQTVVLGENSLCLNDKEISYQEVVKLYELKRCFSILYQGNHVYIIPKNVLDEAQTEEFVKTMKEKIGNAYQNTLKK